MKIIYIDFQNCKENEMTSGEYFMLYKIRKIQKYKIETVFLWQIKIVQLYSHNKTPLPIVITPMIGQKRKTFTTTLYISLLIRKNKNPCNNDNICCNI